MIDAADEYLHHRQRNLNLLWQLGMLKHLSISVRTLPHAILTGRVLVLGPLR